MSEVARLKRCMAPAQRRRDAAAPVGEVVAETGEATCSASARSPLAVEVVVLLPAPPVPAQAAVLERDFAQLLSAWLAPAEVAVAERGSAQLRPAMLAPAAAAVPEPELAQLRPAMVFPARLKVVPAASPWDALRAAKTPFQSPDPLVAMAVARAATRSAAAQRPGRAPARSRPARLVDSVKAA